MVMPVRISIMTLLSSYKVSIFHDHILEFLDLLSKGFGTKIENTLEGFKSKDERIKLKQKVVAIDKLCNSPYITIKKVKGKGYID